MIHISIFIFSCYIGVIITQCCYYIIINITLFKIGELDDCPLADELLTLVEREEEMVKRGVKAPNLAGIRQRILTKFLQLVRSPDHNPEIIRFEKVKIKKEIGNIETFSNNPHKYGEVRCLLSILKISATASTGLTFSKIRNTQTTTSC